MQRRDLHLNGSMGGVGAPEVHFGLGIVTGPLHEVRIRWPDGSAEVHAGVNVDQRMTLTR